MYLAGCIDDICVVVVVVASGIFCSEWKWLVAAE